MRHFIPTLLCLGIATSATACTDDDGLDEILLEFEEAENEAEFRAHGVVPMHIHYGDSTEEIDCDVWDFPPVASGAQAFDSQTGELLLSAEGRDFVLPDGTITCSRDGNELNSTEEIRTGGGGEVLYTVWRRFVFDGALELDGLTDVEKRRVLRSQLLYNFKDQHIYTGAATAENILMTGTASVQDTHRAQKMMTAALIDGNCGTPGLDAWLAENNPPTPAGG